MLADMHEFCRQIYKQILSCYSIFAYKMDMHTIILVHRYYFYRQICDRQHIYCPVLFYNILYYKICPIPARRWLVSSVHAKHSSISCC